MIRKYNDLTFFVVVKSYDLVYNLIDYAKIHP